jgi:hypothetical protein
MKVSRLIELLEKVKENHGDVEVGIYDRFEESSAMVRKVVFNDLANEREYYHKGDAAHEGDICILEC